MPGPNAFLDECEVLVSVSIEDGALTESQLRDLLASFGHLQSFYPSGSVRYSLFICLLVSDRLSRLSPMLQSFPTLDVLRRSLTAYMNCTFLELVSVPNLSPPKSSLRTRPQKALPQNLVESVHAA